MAALPLHLCSETENWGDMCRFRSSVAEFRFWRWKDGGPPESVWRCSLIAPAGSATLWLRWLSHCDGVSGDESLKVALSSAAIATRSRLSSGPLPGGQENWPNAHGNKPGIVGDY